MDRCSKDEPYVAHNSCSSGCMGCWDIVALYVLVYSGPSKHRGCRNISILIIALKLINENAGSSKLQHISTTQTCNVFTK